MNMENIREVFLERLKELMQDKDLNIKDLSEKVKIPRTTINNWVLKGASPQIEYLDILADFFGCTVDFLLGREDY